MVSLYLDSVERQPGNTSDLLSCTRELVQAHKSVQEHCRRELFHRCSCSHFRCCCCCPSMRASTRTIIASSQQEGSTSSRLKQKQKQRRHQRSVQCLKLASGRKKHHANPSPSASASASASAIESLVRATSASCKSSSVRVLVVVGCTVCKRRQFPPFLMLDCLLVPLERAMRRPLDDDSDDIMMRSAHSKNARASERGKKQTAQVKVKVKVQDQVHGGVKKESMVTLMIDEQLEEERRLLAVISDRRVARATATKYRHSSGRNQINQEEEEEEEKGEEVRSIKEKRNHRSSAMSRDITCDFVIGSKSVESDQRHHQDHRHRRARQELIREGRRSSRNAEIIQGKLPLRLMKTSENELPDESWQFDKEIIQKSQNNNNNKRKNKKLDLGTRKQSASRGEMLPITKSSQALQTNSATRSTTSARTICKLAKWKERPRPKEDHTSRWQQAEEEKLFLNKMPSTTTTATTAAASRYAQKLMPLIAIFLLTVSCTLPLLVKSQQQPRGTEDLLTIVPPFAPTRRPAMSLLHSGGNRYDYETDNRNQTTRDRALQASSALEQAQQKVERSIRASQAHMSPMMDGSQLASPAPPQQQQQQQVGNNEPATAASSASDTKFTRTNELDGFLDEMNHKELQTVASGRPIDDFFQPRPFGGTTTNSVANHHSPRAHSSEPAPTQAEQGDRGASEKNEINDHESDPGAHKPGGLMGSHSEQQIYSDCALILQRTYVKNIEDPKHQLVPFGKTEQACISYKHIDKAIEQAKHKLKFREFAKMRKKAAAAAATQIDNDGAYPMSSAAAPPPLAPFEIIHSSLEPPEDLVAAIGEINMAATQIIADQFDLSNDELLNGLPLIDMSKTKFWSMCPLLVKQDLKCEVSRFRTFTGHCNNLKHPTWGAAKTPYARYLPPIHPDGIWVPRKSIVSEITFESGTGADGPPPPPPPHPHHHDIAPSMPHPSHHSPDSPHRLGMSHMSGSSSVRDDEDAELSNQADAELLRESRDDGSHMDMAASGSVHFVRRAHPDLSLTQPPPGTHLQHQFNERHHAHMMAASAPASGQHHPHHLHHLVPAPMHPQIGTAAAAATAPAIVHQHRVRTMPQELPSARLVSSVVHRDMDIPNHDFTMLFMSWGQLLDHDMTRAATPPTTIKCCPQANGEMAPKHKLCLPISVPPNDPFYSKFGVRCLDFRRTLAGVRPNCVLGPRVHQNANTSPIDANFVYGSAQATANALRLFKGGRLRDRDWFRQEGLKPLLPAQEIDPDLSCLGRPRDLFCFLAGDIRVNEQTHLTVLHTLYMREHNRIADKLSELNPHWDDERTFQETRHLMAAGVQHVLINEYIPLLIGRKMTELYNLTVATPSTTITHAHHGHHGHHHGGLHDHGEIAHHQEHAAYWHGYDPSVTTSVSNSFAAAAFRQGHTFVQSTIDRFNKFHEFVSSEKLRNLFMRPFLLYQPGVMDELVSGMINRQSQSYDPFMTEELAGHLFQPPEAQFGHDLASINLQRGRDQGLPGYNLFREWCGLPRAETFEQLEPYLTNRTAFLYSKLYKHVDDIDLWSAGIAERKLPGAAIGPTFSCIIARQFSNTRRGDRFWYENPGLPSSFTPDQLTEIKKFTLAKLICTNADDLPTIQRWVFRMAHPVLNPRVDCSQLPEIDLQYWQEE